MSKRAAVCLIMAVLVLSNCATPRPTSPFGGDGDNPVGGSTLDTSSGQSVHVDVLSNMGIFEMQVPEAQKVDNIARLTVSRQSVNIFNPYVHKLKVVVMAGDTYFTAEVPSNEVFKLPENKAYTTIMAYGSRDHYCSTKLEKNTSYDIMWDDAKQLYCLQPSQYLVVNQ